MGCGPCGWPGAPGGAPARPGIVMPRAPPPAPAPPTPAEVLVRDPGQVLGLRVLDVVDERLSPRPLLGRDVEQVEPVLDLVEHGPIEGHRDQRVEPREGYDVDAALALAGRRDA